MKAYELKRVDKQYDMHLQAWLFQSVQATKPIAGGKKTEPLYKNFKSFFDYEKRIEEVSDPQTNKTKTLSQSQRDLARLAAQVNHV